MSDVNNDGKEGDGMRRSALGRKALTVLVSTAMVVSMMPTAALADAVGAGETPTEQSQVKGNEPGGGDSEKVTDADSVDNGASEDATNGQTTTEQGSTTQTGDDSQQGAESQEPAAAEIAEVNGTKYATLQAAIDAAQDGETVTLLGDVADCGSITISENITLEGNGHTISGNSSINVNMPGNADADVTIHNVIFKDIANGNKLSAFYFSQVKGKLTITNCTFDSIEYEAIQVTPAPGAVINISNNMFKAKADGTQIRHIHIEMAYGSGFDYEGENINLTVTDNQLHGTVSGDASMGIWWVGTDSTLKVDGNYMEQPETVSITLTNSGVRYNRGDLIYPARSNANVDVDDLMPVAIVAEQASGESKIHACNTLADAIVAARDGETVTLLTDVEQNTQLTINKNITLGLNGKTIKNTADIWGDNANAILSIKNDAKVTITGNGTIDAKENDCYTIDVVKGDLTIENGTFYGNISVVQVQEGTLSVKGGTFDLHQKWEGSSKYLFNCIDKAYVDGSANVAISGGTFVGFDPNVSPEQKMDGKTPSFAAPGAGVTKNEDGSFTAAAGMTAQILDKDGNSVKAYTSLQDAVAAANASTEDATISLRKNKTVDHQLVINNAKGKAITLDLNGLTLTSTYAINKDNKNGSYALVNNTPLTIKNGTFAAGQARAIGALETLTLNGVTVTQALTGGHACVAFCANGKSYTIKSSTIEGAYAVCNFANNSTINITGSTLTGTGNTLYHNGSNYGLKLTVKDTTITSSGSCGVYISGSTSAQSNADNQNGAGGYQKAAFTGCAISGAINGVEVKYADLTLDGCRVSTTAEDASYKQDNNGPAGSGFAVVSTDNAMNNVTPRPEGTIIIKGEGKYTGPVGLGSLKSVQETYADFADETIKVSDGTFTTAVPETYCAAGYAPSANANGTYGVKLAEGAYLLQDYRSGDQASWTYPTQEGMAFAGWYKDAAFETACTTSDVEGAAYAKFVKISDLITFKGGSLRTDLTGEDNYSMTSLRFGYEMHAPDGAKLDRENWGWTYRNPNSGASASVKAENYWRIDNNGVITNLVIREISKDGQNANYSTLYEVNAQLAYVTKDGTKVCVKDETRVRSVNDVAEAIKNDSFATDVDLKYANGILGE